MDDVEHVLENKALKVLSTASIFASRMVGVAERLDELVGDLKRQWAPVNGPNQAHNIEMMIDAWMEAGLKVGRAADAVAQSANRVQ